jgi:16S rRNA (cytosine967-C5)-methyltransferase
MSEGLNSRQCALNALIAVFDQQKPLDQSLDKFAKKYNLSPQDKSFSHALCAFVLRYKPLLQKLINTAANRNKDIAPSNLNILVLMGAAQIYLMDSVPDHAAVDTSVQLSKMIRCPKQSGMVNAVLRRLIREGKPNDLKPSLPNWLVNTWAQDYGVDTASQIEQASLSEAKIGVINKTGEWRIMDGDFNLGDDEWVQDYASHIPVSLLDDLKGKHVLDLCAAPGGKTMQLASKHAKVTSIDISEKRLSRLKENLKRTNLEAQVEVICADILKWNPQQKYDVVLLDAPCSATGTIRRHPDLPYIRKASDIQSLINLQTNFLDRVKTWIKGDGLLIYCTCSLQKDESERQIEKFLDNNRNFIRHSMKQHQNYQTPDGDMRLLPIYGDMDGFFISCLSNKPE